MSFPVTPNTIEGSFWAGERISVSGTVSLQGSIVAADTVNTESLVTSNTIGGSLTIACNGTTVGGSALSNKVKVLAWQET